MIIKERILIKIFNFYLRKIFNSPTDNVEMYLLVSDILGSDTETLAHATSGKRKNAQNKLLAKLFERDAGHIPTPVELVAKSSDEKIKQLIDIVLAKKGVAYRYLVFSKLRNEKNVTEELILEVASKEAAFSDSFAIDKLVKASEVLTLVKTETKLDFDIAVNASLVQGTWNAKTEKIDLIIVPKKSSDLEILNKSLSNLEKRNPELFKLLSIKADTTVSGNMARSKLPNKIDPDVLLKIYSFAGFKNSGLYKSITYNGNVTFDTLPISKFENPNQVFQFSNTPAKPGVITGGTSGNCSDAISAFLRIIN